MELEIVSRLDAGRRSKWLELICHAGLTPDEDADLTALLWDGNALAAAGSRKDNILKCFAVSESHRGDGLTATILTALRQDALRNGFSHLFLYTKPENQYFFSSLFFYPVAKTRDVLLMENRKQGLRDYLASFSPPNQNEKKIGALIMNCDPFTKGHRYLIEYAANECDHVYVFVLSEDRSYFSASDRLMMARLGTADLYNITVIPTGPYLISAATFPTYFLKDRDSADQIHCLLDIQIFVRHYARHFRITHRYVGTEQLSALTARYNEILADQLPSHGIDLIELPRLSIGDAPISASTVRNLINQGEQEAIRELVPESTVQFLLEHNRL